MDWPRLTAHAKGLLTRGVTSLTLFGTTGEGASIAAGERDQAHDRLQAEGVSFTLAVEGVLQSALRDAAAQGRRALSLGCAALLLAPPFYYRPTSQEAVFAWFAAAIEAMGAEARDIVLYNIPGVTGVAIGTELVGQLRTAFPGIVVGVKDSSGDFANTRQLLADHRDLCILVGHEGHLADAMELGASGSISGVANFEPELVARLVAGKRDERAHPLVDMIVEVPVVSAIKQLIAHRTGDPAWTSVRPPLQGLSAEEATSIVDRYSALFGPWEEMRVGA